MPTFWMSISILLKINLFRSNLIEINVFSIQWLQSVTDYNITIQLTMENKNRKIFESLDFWIDRK